MTKGEEIIQLQNRIKELEEQVKIKNDLVFLLDEAIPKEGTARKRYMADIALFYGTIFKEKLQHFISDQLTELAQIGRTELGSNIIRSNINCFRLIDTWMKDRTNEHLGNLQEMREKFKDEEEFINQFKETYSINTSL